MKKVVAGLLLLLFVGCSPYSFLSKEKQKLFKQQYKDHSPYQKIIAEDIKLGLNDTICDIATGFGLSISILSDYLPASTIYFVEDINRGDCSKKSFKNAFDFYGSKANINNFRFAIGTKENIPYPSNLFNNITVFISIHEFTDKELMLTEIDRIMRDTGSLYVLENVYKDTVVKDENCGFDYLKESELYRLIDKANFKIIKDTTFGKETETENSYSRFFICRKK